MKSLVRLFSFNSYVWLMLAVFVVLAFIFAPGGFSLVEIGVLAVFAVAAVGLGLALRTPRSKLTSFDGMTAFEAVLRGPRPTLLEFYSENCGVCMAMKPVMDRLERDARHPLPILRINVKKPLRISIPDRYRITFTPTVLLFNGSAHAAETVP